MLLKYELKKYLQTYESHMKFLKDNRSYEEDGFTGDLITCNEGNLEWVPKGEVTSLPIWEGDKLFFEELIADRGFFTMKLRYEGDCLVESSVKHH